MAGNHDYVALDWVKGEIDSTLKQAQLALEDYVNNTEDSAKLRFCLNYIHQVHGTLQMVEFYGAALLAEEMEKLAQAVLQETVPHPDEAIEVLMRAILQLPNYLNRLQSSRRDLPVILLPILNDLRASRGESLLSDTSLFTPDLSMARVAAPPGVNQRLHDDKVIMQLRKLRQMYQFALAGVIRESELPANFSYMGKVFKRLESLCRDTAQGQIWRVAHAFIEALVNNGIDLSSAIKNLLRALDYRIKKVIDENIDILVQAPPEDLLKHLLYYVARSDARTPAIEGVREDYRLDQALPSDEEVDIERQKMSGPDKGAIESVVEALNEELARVKDQLDLFVRGEFKDSSDLAELLPGLHQVANTMAVLGLGIPRKVVQEQIDLIDTLSSGTDTPDDNVLMDIAGALLYVEATLSGFSDDAGSQRASSGDNAGGAAIPKEQVDNAHEAVIREARNGLEQAKTDIVEYIASHWDRSEIESVPKLLQSIRGGLRIIPLERAADLLDASARYIQDRLLDSDQSPDWNQLDTLADAITSIEYYLERLSEGSQDNELILQVAEESLAQLGYPVGDAVAIAPQTVAGTAPTMSAPPESSRDKASDKELIDDEIVEIFVEEAEEVLATIHNYFPSFQSNPDDQVALAEIRRAFHTLKGSGRLVGATTLGELAWSVENMLNRVIDGSITATLEMFELLEGVINKLPELIERFKTGQEINDVDQFVAKAEALAAARRLSREKSSASDIDLSVPKEEPAPAPVEEPVAASEPEAPVVEETQPEPIEPPSIPEPVAETVEVPEPEEEDEDDMIDDEIIEIFVEEAAEVLDTIGQYLPSYVASYDNQEALIEVRRAFHTLKGSGRLVGATLVGELAWSIENLLNRIIDGTIFMSQDIGELMQAVTKILPDLVEDFKLRRKPSHNTQPYMDQAHAIAKGEIPKPLKLDQDASASESGEPTLDIDPALKDIFKAETESHLETLATFTAKAAANGEPTPITDEISRAMHTLKGSANTAGIEPIATVVVPLEKFVKEARARGVSVDSDIRELLQEGAGFVRRGLDQIESTPLKPLDGANEYLEKLATVSNRILTNAAQSDVLQATSKPDPQLINLFLTEGVDILLDAERILNEWSQDPNSKEDLNKLVTELTTLSRGAEVAGLEDVAELSRALETAYELAEAGGANTDDRFFTIAKRGHDVLISMMDQVAAGLATQPDASLIQELYALAKPVESAPAGDVPPVAEVAEEESLEPVAHSADDEIPLLDDVIIEEAEEDDLAEDINFDIGLPEEPEVIEPSASFMEEIEETPAPVASGGVVYELDPELADVFLQEAQDIIQSSADVMQQWSQDLHNIALVQQLQRDLHTLKGGARLAGIPPIGDLSHELESLFEGIVEQRVTPDEEASNLSLLAHDTLAGMVDSVTATRTCNDAQDLIDALHAYLSGERSAEDEEDEGDEVSYDEASLPTMDFNEEEEIPVLEEVAPLDPEMVEIFLEEAQDIIQRTGETMHSWSEELGNLEHLKELQRDLHTLKGGARMAEIKSIGDLAHELETLFERMTEGRLSPEPAMVGLVMECHDRLAGMVDAVAQNQVASPARDLIGRVHDMAQGAGHHYADGEDDYIVDAHPEVEAAVETSPESQVDQTAIELEGLADAEEITAEPAPVEEAPIENPVYDISGLDQELVSIFLEEANELVDSTARNLQSWLGELENIEHVKELQRALHTLKGGARMAEIKPIGDLAHELETLFEGIVEGRFLAEPSLSDLMLACHDRLAEMVDSVTSNSPVRAANDLAQQVIKYCAQHDLAAKGPHDREDTILDIEREQQSLLDSAQETSDEDLRSIFLDESRDIMDAVIDCFDRWKANPDNITPAKELVRDLQTLNGGAKLANIDSVHALTEALTERMESVVDGKHQVPDELITLVDRSIRYIGRLLDQIEQLEQPEVPNELIRELKEVGSGEELPATEFALDVDPEILQVFVEEANELQASLEREFNDWTREPRNSVHADSMSRALHTLKGGARLATLTNIGDLAQEIESVVKEAYDHKHELDDALRSEIEILFNRLKSEIGQVKNFYSSQQEAEVEAVAAEAPKSEPEALAERMVQMQREQAVPAVKKEEPAKTEIQPAQPAAQRQAAAETVRVSANLLDNLVNLAGETSITRGLLEQQISDFTYTLEEMQSTIDRLREQLRRMDMETEAQVLFRMEKESGVKYEDFDPLEMDRYSSIQQLSRALSESSSDLTDLRETMMDKARDAETLLLQQSRINTELQEGLMKTRMVPFTSIVPRLRRIIRQVSSELGKKADFEVYNPEGELDRTVLERMLAPLEHMLRNAIDHGVEMPEQRRAKGKSETGRIELSVGREGGDVVLILSDDGGGINVDAVRNKAIKSGLIDEGTHLSDHDMLQFIFQAGFSTAEKVTQISGRGVGMDVVASEIKQLGGRVTIDSKPGHGTRFIVHLPFTVSVNRALMVNTGEDYYAIPLNTIEGIVRVSTYELEEYYKPNAPLYEYAGQKYRLQYLGSLLKSEHHPKLQGQPLPLPVILVRGGGDQPLALQVDSLMGSREIVVKGLGTQFSSVRGVSGATILGDGSVVVILDLPALIRSDMSHYGPSLIPTLKPAGEPARAASGPTTVMVVDDSVTVRKVTSRLLERNGMEVITAKDGVDAIALLQDHKPDVMLLDIEMPRMDGFEVASLVRHDERLKDVPIIMITSRTGQKHRERAISIGVNEYLGKPFQEKILLETIERLVE
ncbi:Hpt domain-containing protein [Hahella sp. HN01]|uniref:hybrid sensor histidine kinase/response regulator n=1 Tax=Hahella sp. HN01 TaxID=2847262 RepID=UPI001C1EF427|nr:Hpt domain-containing protein [Hahella sp. HN01]MBU6954167.1 Hpt domain-containing protein [Hahella sp. HN01]